MKYIYIAYVIVKCNIMPNFDGDMTVFLMKCSFSVFEVIGKKMYTSIKRHVLMVQLQLLGKSFQSML